MDRVADFESVGWGFESLQARQFNMVDVAQLVSASDCGSEGRGFESPHPPHFLMYRSSKEERVHYFAGGRPYWAVAKR